MSKVLDTADLLDGKAISDIELSPEAGSFVTAFKVDFADGSQGLYYFHNVIPEPTALACLGLSFAVLPRRRR